MGMNADADNTIIADKAVITNNDWNIRNVIFLNFNAVDCKTRVHRVKYINNKQYNCPYKQATSIDARIFEDLR